MPAYTQLKGFDNIGQSSIGEMIESNLIMFFDWGFQDKGAFFNVSVPISGQYGGDRSQLRLVKDPNYVDGRVWEAFRSNWAWQSGMSTATQPTQVAGVNVNNIFYPLATVGAFAHHVDYPRGRIVFNTPIATNSIVKCGYSYKWINVVSSSKILGFRTVQVDSFRNDNSQFSQSSSGDWFTLADTRLQLPAVAIEVPTGGTSKPYALGGGQWVYRNCIFHVFAENEQTTSRIADIIQTQNEKTIFLVNPDNLASSNKFPLNAAGSINAGALSYPDMISQFMYNRMRFIDAESQQIGIINPSFFHLPVKMTIEVVLGNI
jgi:hypothetical protein